MRSDRTAGNAALRKAGARLQPRGRRLFSPLPPISVPEEDFVGGKGSAVGEFCNRRPSFFCPWLGGGKRKRRHFRTSGKIASTQALGQRGSFFWRRKEKLLLEIDSCLTGRWGGELLQGF